MKTHYYKQYIIDICEEKHLTVDQIVSELQSIFKEVGKSSIYRNVEELVQEWKLKKLSWLWNKTYFEKEKEDHIHLIDKTSWKIVDFDLRDVIQLSNLPDNFKTEDFDIKIYWQFV